MPNSKNSVTSYSLHQSEVHLVIGFALRACAVKCRTFADPRICSLWILALSELVAEGMSASGVTPQSVRCDQTLC